MKKHQLATSLITATTLLSLILPVMANPSRTASSIKENGQYLNNVSLQNEAEVKTSLAKASTETASINVLDNITSFDGTQKYVEIPDNPNLNFGTGDLTISAKVKTTSTSGIEVILDKRVETSGSVQGYHLVNSNGKLLLQLADGVGQGWTNYESGVSIADDKLHHIAVTVDRDQADGGRWYLDGVEVGNRFNPTARQGSLDNSKPLVIGKRSDDLGGSGFFKGDIGYVRLFKRVLSAQEIAALSNANPNPPQTPLDKEVSELIGLPKPPIVGTDYLAQAGMPDPGNLFQSIEHKCNIDVKAKWPFGSEKGNCLFTTPQGYLLVKGDVQVEEKQRTCSKETDEFSADGAVVKSRSEIENIYDAAIKLAVKDKSIVDGLIKMRDYHLRAYDFASNRGTHRVVVSAKAGAVRRAICGGYVRDVGIRL